MTHARNHSYRPTAGRTLLTVATICLGLIVTAPVPAAMPGPPAAPVRPVVDDYFGTKVTDPYRWMEDRHGAEFLEWARKENDYTRAVLASIPNRDELLKRIQELDSGGTLVRTLQTAAGLVVYQKRGPTDDVYKLYLRKGRGGQETLLFDPTAGAAQGRHRSIDYIQLSPDGAHVVVGVSEGGSEESVLRVLETSTDKSLPERIDRTEYASPAWLPDGKSFFYNRFAKIPAGAPETAKYLNSKAYWHTLGDDPEHDKVMLAVDAAPEVSITPVDAPFVGTASDSRYVLGVISHGSAPEATIYVKALEQAINNGAPTPWRKVADVDDAVAGAALHDGDIYLLSHKNASRYQILKVSAAEADLRKAQTVIPSGNVVIQDMGVAKDALYVKVLDAGVHRVLRMDYATNKVTNVSDSVTGGIAEIVTDPQTNGALFPVLTWTGPERWYVFDPATGAPHEAHLVPPSTIDTSNYEFEEVRVKAKDGTQIPLSLIHKRGLPEDGRRPTWLTGYGAYGIAMTPRFVPGWFALLERGGLVAVAHVRGGGEFGEDWHNAGRQATKPNTYRDLIACAEYLIQQHYTRPANLAIQGGSAGGITVGMALAERPDLFRVVLSDVGDSNALRAEYETDGDANALEYGSAKNEAGFKALYAVDAFHHVKDGTAYPATLLTTGINDPRVAPWQPGKMAARLQAANNDGRPILLRVDYDAGHGIGSTRAQREELLADQLAFMLWQTGDPDFQTPAR
jgi:prolyl oligopeptidase